MASGKTVRLIMAAESARKVVSQVVFIKHRVDTRSNAVTSRSGLRVPADFVVDRLCSLDAKADILYAVDEAQFYPDLMDFWAKVHSAGAYMAAAGLDRDFARRPFGQVLDLAAAAATGSAPCVVERLSARCTHGATGVCSRPAVFSQRLSMTAKEGDESVVAIGGGERYQPACELHHVPHAVPYDAWYSDAAAQLRDDALR